MTKVTTYYGISAVSLPFWDVQIEKDTLGFVDPHIIRNLSIEKRDTLSTMARTDMDDFCKAVFQGITSNKQAENDVALKLLSELPELKYTRLGYSVGGFSGHGSGGGLGEQIFNALNDDAKSLIQVGVLCKLEEIGALVPGVGPDRISDLTIDIVMGSLLEFTQQMINKYPEFRMHGHKLTTLSTRIWDAKKHEWVKKVVKVPEAAGEALVLIPQLWVSPRLEFNSERYRETVALGFIQTEHTTFTEHGKKIKPSKKSVKSKVDPKVETNIVITNRAIDNGQNLLSDYARFVDSKIGECDKHWYRLWHKLNRV